jgi:hypothetical protein
MAAAAQYLKNEKTADIAVPEFEVRFVEGKNFPR